MNVGAVLPLVVACTQVLMTSLPSVQSVSYVADIRFYVDRYAYLKYQTTQGVKNFGDLESFIKTMVQDINDNYYKSLSKYSLDLQLKLEKVVYVETIKAGDGKNLHVQSAYTGFEKYLVDYKLYNSSFDLTLWLTGLDLYAATGNTYGAAYVGDVCRDIFRSGVSEVTGTLAKDSLTVSHELGHIFGAYHDETCSPDRYTAGNIMNTVNVFDDPDRFEFSHCSYGYIYKKFTSLKKNCMLDTKIEPAAEETPDQVCQKLYGNKYRLHRATYHTEGYGDNFCKEFVCIAKIDGKYKYPKSKTQDGLPCGLNKRCKSGTCQPAKGTPFNKACPWGNQDFSVWPSAVCSPTSCSSWKKDWCCTFCLKA